MSAAGGARGRVLIVDDNAPIRELAELIAKGAGWDADEAPGGREALAMLAQRHYDCVLLDIAMPDVSGEDVFLAIRRDPILARMRVVAYTANAMTHEVARYKALGFDAIVTKPATIQELRAALSGPVNDAAALPERCI